ncbi:MAG: redoxin domain-containing protein, partial [Blastocatellia bacterium]|nr:redoxin domain-containing protein [Blastocatellia bacterium]
IKTPRSQNGIEGLKFPLASDAGGRLSRVYNILVEEPNIALRGLYIIDPDGVLQYSVVHAINTGRSVDETLRVLQAIQTGGFCAADWKPGQKTL